MPKTDAVFSYWRCSVTIQRNSKNSPGISASVFEYGTALEVHFTDL